MLRRARHLGPRDWLLRVSALVLAVGFAIFFAIPIVWLLLATTKEQRQLLLDAPFSFGSFDTVVENFELLTTFQDGLIWSWLGNSVLYSGTALLLTLAITIPAGYALALIEFKGRGLLLTLTLITMLIPNPALVLPIFLELSEVGLIGSAWSVILPFSFFPFGVYLTYIYFGTTISQELLDAARVDGAGEMQVFTRVAMPLAKADHRTRGLLQLRRQLEQLLPAIRDGVGTQVPGAGRPGRVAVQRVVVQLDVGRVHQPSRCRCSLWPRSSPWGRCSSCSCALSATS